MFEKLHRWTDDEEGIVVPGATEEPGAEDIQDADRESDVIDYQHRIRPEDEY